MPLAPLPSLLLLALAFPLSSQDDLPLGGEGPLRNGTFLPQAEPAAEALARGDESWARARDGGAGASLERVAAFDAWADALAASATGDGVRVALDGQGPGPWPDPDETAARRLEGVEVAVLRRLTALSETDRDAWRTRFEPLARAALDAAGSHLPALAEVERRYPATAAATLAALRGADGALEAGRFADARTWCARARRHAAFGPEREGLTAALARRESLADRLAAAPRLESAPETWADATELELVRTGRLESRRLFGRVGDPPPLGRDLTPGATFLADGDAVLQSALTLTWLDADALESPLGGRIGRVLWSDVLPGDDQPRPFVAPSAGGWPLLPVARGRDVVVVVDRGQPGRFVRDVPVPARGNHLLRLRIEEDGRVQVAWHLSDRGLAAPDAATVALEEALGVPGRFEFQPGPILHEGLVLAQARRLPQPTQGGVFEGDDLWLFALELRTGAVRWKRALTDAADLRRDLGRNASRSEIPTTAMPLAVHAGVVVAGTNVGLVGAWDGADGRLLWGLRTQRRLADEAGWPGSRPPHVVADPAGPAVVVAPFDSEFDYRLPLRGVISGPLLLAPPRPRGELLDIAVADAPELLLGRDGRHRALQTRDEHGGLRSILYLDEGERFAGTVAASPRRVILGTDRTALLLDRERDLYLLDAVPLPDLGGGRGGSVAVRGATVILTGADSYWILRAR